MATRSVRPPRRAQDETYAVDTERRFTSSIVKEDVDGGLHYPTAVACGISSRFVNGGEEHDVFVIDATNRLYVMDKQGTTRKTIGGSGGAPGCFKNAQGLVMSADGQTAYVADTGNDRIQRIRIHDSQTQAIAGGNPRPGMQARAYGLQSLAGGEILPKRYALESLNQPHGIAIHDESETLFVCDTWNHRIVVLSAALPTNFVGLARATSDDVPVIPELQALRRWGTKGRATGCFQYPKGIAVAPSPEPKGSPEVIVADTRNHRLQCFTPDGKYTRGVDGGENGAASGTPGRMNGSALFSFPTNVCVSTHAGRFVFVADQRSIVVLNLDRLVPICAVALSNPTRSMSARRATHPPAAALCVHPPERPREATLQHLYVAEYDEHSVREVILSAADLRTI